MNLNEFGEYKQKILSKLRNSADVKNLLLGDDYDDEIVDDLLNESLFPYLYIPDTQTEARSYICVDVVVPNIPDFSIKNLMIIVWVFSHKSLMEYKKRGYIGTRTDSLSNEVNNLINTSRDFGIGRLKLKDVDLFQSEKTYYGRILRYEASDFNTDRKLV